MLEINRETRVRRLQSYERSSMYDHLLEESGLVKVADQKEEVLSGYLVKEILPGLLDQDVYQIWTKNPRLFCQQTFVTIRLWDIGLEDINEKDPGYPNGLVGQEKYVYPPGTYKRVYHTVTVHLHHPFPCFTNKRNNLILDGAKLKGDQLLTLQQLMLDLLSARFDQENFRCHERTADPTNSYDWAKGYGFLKGNGVHTLGQLLKYDEDLFLWFCNEYAKIDYTVKEDEDLGQVPATVKADPTKDYLVDQLAKLRKILGD